MTALHHAVSSDNIDCVTFILKEAPHLVTAQDVWKCVPLHRVRSVPLARALLNCGGKDKIDAVTRADVKDTKIMAGDSALHVSVRYALPEICYVLIKAGANLNLTNRSGESPLDVAVECMSESCGSILVREGAIRAVWGARKVTWYQAVETRLTFLLEYMQRKGCQSPINMLHENQETPLHLSCSLLSANITKILIEARADVSLRDRMGQTALHRATSHIFDTDSSSAETNCDGNARVVEGVTELTLLEECLLCVTYVLEENDGIIPVRANDKKTAVHTACASGSLRILKLIFQENYMDKLVKAQEGVEGLSSTEKRNAGISDCISVSR